MYKIYKMINNITFYFFLSEAPVLNTFCDDLILKTTNVFYYIVPTKYENVKHHLEDF